jgi:hypothetical protein
LAEDFRDRHSQVRVAADELRAKNLAKECVRQFDNCRYSAAALFVWKKSARLWRAILIVAPIVLGGFASSQLLLDAGPTGTALGALSGILAGIFPAIAKALDLDVHIESIQRAASEFTNLRDRFRRAATVTSLVEFEQFNAEVEALMDRMDAVRVAAPPTPDWCFRKAQKKIEMGDYDFDLDKTEQFDGHPEGGR